MAQRYGTFVLLILLNITGISAFAQDTTVIYTIDSTDFANPERGFYLPSQTYASSFKPLESPELKNQFRGPAKHGSASYAIYPTLLLREYVLDTFKDKLLSESFLQLVDKDLQAVKDAGIKVILRFCYVNKTHKGSCPDKEGICPPYGDAPKQFVLNHIRQLRPLFAKHVSIIALVQEGFIGIWGENYYTDYFGDASDNGNGKLLNEDWNARREVLTALLNSLPPSLMVQVRTPQIKQKFLYGPEAPVESAPMDKTIALSGAPASRIGFHNDCFLASPDDYGTYNDYGSSSQPKQSANDALRRYVEQDSKYVVVGGETCDDAYSPQNDCPPAGRAIDEMQAMHYSFLNTTYNNDVNNDWDSMGCINTIRKKLGYRLVLKNGIFPKVARKGDNINIHLTMENEGFASPFKLRPVYFVLRDSSNNKIYSLKCRSDIRTWFTGVTRVEEHLKVPVDMMPGRYELLLWLPDSDVLLHQRPAYSIRLANKNCWEAATGYNKLNVFVEVR
ncbi:DUF4832 domain-containing protein [Danxiaibacter flavus]|uniref:DUF4832 domain-containing protein n=1 Tax=Danxiaibacter flavus TaxID=3049108 RepID=A0ABV3ZKA4_9BACT|nr:DUF4832 domain-containing protein [Chitinophagaceae bacterium DXS]